MIVLWLAAAQAATLELTVSDAVRMVEERNPDLRSADLSTAVAKITAQRARLDRFTAQVSVAGGADLGFVKPWGEPVSDTQSASWDARARGGVVLWSGGRVDGTIRGADADVAVTDQSAALTRRDLQRAAYTAYWNVKGIELSIGATEDGLSASKEALAIIEAKAKAGLSADLDVNRSKVGVVSQQADLVSQRQRLYEAELELCRLLQLEDTDLVLTDEIPTVLRLDPVQIPEDAGASRPELAQLRSRQDGVDAAVTVARSAALPTVALEAELGAGGFAQGGGTPVFGVTPEFDAATLRPGLDGRVGVVVSWNPFDLFRAKMNVDQTQLQGQQIAASTESTELRIATDIRVAGRQVEVLQAQVPLVEEQMALARSNLQIVQDLYAQGNATILDLFNAQDQFRSSRLREADLLVRLRLAEVDLSWALARDLEGT